MENSLEAVGSSPGCSWVGLGIHGISSAPQDPHCPEGHRRVNGKGVTPPRPPLSCHHPRAKGDQTGRRIRLSLGSTARMGWGWRCPQPWVSPRGGQEVAQGQPWPHCLIPPGWKKGRSQAHPPSAHSGGGLEGGDSFSPRARPWR